MGSTRYVSFISGVIIASITWSFSIYLYSKLSQNPNNVSPTMFLSQSPKTYEFHSWLNKSTFKNSDKLLQQLQPVPVEPDVPLGDGMKVTYIIILIKKKQQQIIILYQYINRSR